MDRFPASACLCEPCYPEEFPIKGLTNVVSYLRGDPSVDLACAAHCAWVAQGFAMSFIPHDHPMVGTDKPEKPPATMDNNQLATAIESRMKKDKSKGVAVTAESGEFLIILLPFIREAANRLMDLWFERWTKR